MKLSVLSNFHATYWNVNLNVFQTIFLCIRKLLENIEIAIWSKIYQNSMLPDLNFISNKHSLTLTLNENTPLQNTFLYFNHSNIEARNSHA